MQKSGRWLLLIGVILLMTLASLGVTACAGKPKPQRPPVTTPIALDQLGIVAEFEMEVREHLLYEYFLSFKFPEGDQVERARLRKILGGYEVDKFGRALEPGAPTPIVLTITQLIDRTELKIFRKEIDPILTSWGGDSFDKNIGHCDLPPGLYRVRLENMREASEFASMPVKFVVGMNKFKFSFDPKKSDSRTYAKETLYSATKCRFAL